MTSPENILHYRRHFLLALLVALVLVVTVLLLRPAREPTSGVTIVEWVSREEATRADHLYDLPVHGVYGMKGLNRSVPVPDVSVADGEALLMMRLDFLDEFGSWYRVAIDDFVGDDLWEEEIPEEFLFDGQCFLLLQTTHLTPGRYAIEIIEVEDDGFSEVIAESAFRIVD